MLIKPTALGIFLSLFSIFAFGQCGVDPTSGTVTINSANQILNSYFPGTGNPIIGGTTLTVGTIDARGNAATLANGDLVLIIQMQGADINSSNSDSYGDGISGGNGSGYLSSNLFAGKYEYNTVASFSASTITFSYPLTNNYYTQAFSAGNSIRQYQVLRVQRNYNLIVNAGASVTCPAWNGSTGGVLALDAANTLTINGSILASALGFRGGGGKNFVGADPGNTNGVSALVNTDQRWNSPVTTAENKTGGAKGEGVAGTPVYVLAQNATTTTINTVEGYINGSMGMGSAGNAGGGGTDGIPVGSGNNQYNSGGGGGSNAGLGGKGGSGWHGNVGNSTTYPYGGYGGISFTQNAITRFIMGGGGGAGTANNSNAANEYQSSGGCGGGIIITRAKLYAGNGSILADGGDAPAVVGVGGTANTDAAGGGGAGGTIVFVTRQAGATGLSTITASAKGGKGGDMTNYFDHGPGGGGGGGIIHTNGSFASTNVTGTMNGKTRTGTTSGPITNDFGASAGSNGLLVTSAGVPVLVNSNNLSGICGVLPITLLNFYAVAKPGTVNLFWQVERAVNFHHFDVEYSLDGSSFIKAGTVIYNSNTNMYQFNHPPSPGAVVIHYRLKMFDISGASSYSKVVIVRLGNATTSTLFPNPAKTKTTLQFSSVVTEQVVMLIIDETGRTVSKKSLVVNPGNNFFPIDCNHLASGYYLVKLISDKTTILKQQLLVTHAN